MYKKIFLTIFFTVLVFNVSSSYDSSSAVARKQELVRSFHNNVAYYSELQYLITIVVEANMRDYGSFFDPRSQDYKKKLDLLLIKLNKGCQYVQQDKDLSEQYFSEINNMKSTMPIQDILHNIRKFHDSKSLPGRHR